MAHPEVGLRARLRRGLRRFTELDEGQDVVEYGLLAAFISIAAVLTLSLIGPLVDNLYQEVLDVLQLAP